MKLQIKKIASFYGKDHSYGVYRHDPNEKIWVICDFSGNFLKANDMKQIITDKEMKCLMMKHEQII